MKFVQLSASNKLHQELYFGPYWEDHCPVCDSKAVSGCRCPINERECGNGHEWHRVDGKVVMGTGH